MIKHCPICGDEGFIWETGEVCRCRKNIKSLYDTVSCLDIPEQYRGILFNKALVPKDLSADYADFLDSVHTAVSIGKWTNKNVLIASPIQHSKSIMAYSCINAMFRGGIDIFPIYDVLELYRILTDMDLGKNSTYAVEDPERILSVPILFAKIPRVSRWEVFDCISMLVDRRVRRGTSTILLYDGDWHHLSMNDRNEILTGMRGNGNFGTIEIKSWSLIPTKKEIEFQANIG